MSEQVKRYDYGYKDDGCGGDRYLGLIEKPDGALLATPPADAADMGGQAGEEVEVVQDQCREICETDWEECGVEGFNYCNRSPLHDTRTLMTVSQHLRILAQRDAAIEEWSGTAVQNGMECDRLAEELAQHRQQAGKLVEALRKLTAAMACHDATPEEYNALAGAREALADWEKTQ